jgi:hypothetical protein
MGFVLVYLHLLSFEIMLRIVLVFVYDFLVMLYWIDVRYCELVIVFFTFCLYSSVVRISTVFSFVCFCYGKIIC